MNPIDSYKCHRQCQKFQDPSNVLEELLERGSSPCFGARQRDVSYQDCHLILNLVESYTPFPMLHFQCRDVTDMSNALK